MNRRRTRSGRGGAGRRGQIRRRIVLGDVAVDRIVESDGPMFDPFRFYPDCTPEALDAHRDWLEPRFVDPATGWLNMVMQSFLVRTPHLTVLVDSCVGNHKERRVRPAWNMRDDGTWLANLAAAGVAPEDVDYVLCTHLHPDHVGWNTRLANGRWVPTFPNARYLFALEEYAFWEGKSAKDARKYDDGAFADSVLPVVEAGRHELVADDHALGDHIRLEPSPGHTPGHVSIRLASRGREAVLSGDLMHTVLQCVYPDWSSAACFDKAQSRATRRAFLERHCDTDALVVPAHFPAPTAGRVVRAGDAWRFRFLDADG